MNDDFEKLAQRYGVSLPKTPDVDQVSHLLKRMRDSVETQESGGRQGIRNPRTDATGLFQVMPANIAPWTKKYVGRAMSQDEFIRDKDAQEKVFQGEMGSYLRQALKRTDNEDEAIRMGAAAWYGGPDDMHRYDDPKRFRPDEPSFREYTTSVLGRIKKTPQVPQIDFDKLSSRYLQGNEFSSLAERYGVAPTQPIVEGQKPLLRPGQPLGTDLPPTNPTGVPLQTGVTAPVAQPVQQPVQQSDVNVLYKDFLAQTGLPDSQESVNEFNLAQKASVEGANAENAKNINAHNAKVRNQPVAPRQQRVQPPVQQPPAQSSATQFEIDLSDKPANQTYSEWVEAKTATALAQQTGASYDTVRRAMAKFPTTVGQSKRRADEEYYAQLAKQGDANKVEVGQNIFDAIARQDAAEKNAQARMEESRQKILTQQPDLASSPEMLDVMAAQDAKLLGKNQGDKLLLQKRNDYIDWLVAKGYAEEDAVKKAFGIDTNRQLSALEWAWQRNPLSVLFKTRDDMQKQVQTDLMNDLQKYGSLADATKEAKRLDAQRAFSQGIGQPSEALKTAARYVAQIPSTVLETASIAAEANPLMAGYELAYGETAVKDVLMSAAKDWRDTVEKDLVLGQNPAYRKDFVVNHLAEGLSQFAVQMIAAPLTGGASLAFPLAEGATAQYREAYNAGASKEQRLMAATVGAVMAAPEVLLNAKFLGGTKGLPFVKKLTEGLFARFSKSMAEAEARELTALTFKSFVSAAAKNGVLNSLGEYSQEQIEDIGNKTLQKLTYKPEITWEEVFVPTSEERKGYLAAGIAGLGGAGVETVIEKMPDAELRRGEEYLSKMLEEGRLTDNDYKAAVNFVKAELRARANKQEYFDRDKAIQASVDKEVDTLKTVEDIPIVGTDVEAGTKVRLKPQDVSIKPENIDTSTERVDTVNIPEQKPLTVIPDKQGKRQDRIEFKEPEAKPLATIPEKKGKRQDKVAFQNQKTAPLQTIPEKGNQKTVVLDSPKQERKKAPSVAELKQTEKGLDELYGKIDIAKDSTDYGYTSNQLAKIGALIDITPEGQKLTALKQREAEIQANHKIATKQYSQALKEREKVEKKAKAQWQNEAEKLTNDELIAKYNELFYPAMGNIVTRDELVRKEIEKRGLTDKIGQGVDPFKKLARTGEKAVNESSGIRWVLDRMVNADQVKGALDYAKSLTYEGEQYLPSNLLWDISQNKYADEATKKEARQLYDKAMGVVSTPREQLHAEKEKERAQRYAKKKITAPPKPAPVTPIQADDEVSWVQDGQTQTGIVQKVSGLSAVIEDAAGDTHRVLLTSLKRPDVIEFKSVPQKTPKRDRPSQPALVTEGKELPKPEKDNVIRDGDIINNGVKTGIYREIDGKKRVQFYGGTPTISNTTEYKEGKWEKGEGDLMESARPEFYSQLERTIEQKMPAKASAEQVRGIIKDTKQEERDWLGIDQWLDEHPTATKEEVLQFVRENNAKIEVVEKGKSVYQPQFDITQSEDTQGNPIWQVKLNGKFLTALKRERFPTEDDVQNYASRHYRDANIQETDDTKFSQYVLPGGENYREMLLTLPGDAEAAARRIMGEKWWARASQGDRDAMVKSSTNPANVFKSPHFNEPNILVHIRFDDRTVDGKKILHIAEIQSDWHQAGRKKGYAPSPAEITKAKDLVDTTRQALQSAIKARDAAREPMIESLYLDGKKVAEIDINKGETFGNYLTRIDRATWDAANLSRRDEVDFRSLKNNFDENAVEGRWNIRRSYALSESERDTQTRLNEANRAYNRAVEALQKLNGEVPDAPFKKSWHELALKKALHYAVTNGYDAISWDTGETQADRYDLSKQVDSINVPMVNDDGSRAVRIDPKDGESFKLMVDDKGIVTGNYSASQFSGKSLDDVIGKEMAQKVMDAPSNTKFTGIDLKVGGEGMKGFYDKILPAFANKYTKKWGGKVEPARVVTEEGNKKGAWAFQDGRIVETAFGDYDLFATRKDTGKEVYLQNFDTRAEAEHELKLMQGDDTTMPVHRLDITPAMRESVMQGQPMFAVRQSDVQANERSFENAKKLDIEELLPLVDMKDIEHTDEGILEVNDIPAYELVRRTLATAMNASPDFNGVFTDPDQVNAFVNTAERLAGQADAVGQDGQKFRDLAKMVKQVAKTDGSVIFLLSKEALPHEIVHKTFYFTRDPNKTRENQIPTDQLEAMAQTPIFKHIQRALGWRSYKKKKLATQMEEAATHIVRGEWDVLNIDTEEQTRDAARLALAYLKAFAKQNAREGKSEDDILKILAKEITYAEEVQKYIQLEGVQAEREADVQGAEDSNVRPTRRGTGETVSEKYRPSGEERLSQTPISAREKANIPLKDDPYISASNATQQDFANTQLAKGLDKATDWFNSQVEDGNLNNGATGVVGLNLLNAYAQQGRYAEMDAVAEKLVPMIRSAAQSVQAMRILAKFNPEKALAYATMRKMARTGLPLTDREINRLTPKIENLNNAEIDKAAVETAITELQNALERANAEIADLEQAIKDAEKPTTETKESVTKKIPTKRELRSREELEKAIRKSYGTDLMESVRDDSRQDIVDLIALDILDYKTPAETLEHIEVLTGNALTQEEFASLQLEAWNSLRPPAISRSAEQQAKLDARTAHRRLAFQTRGQKQGPKKPNVFEREVLAQGTELGYTEQEITGAILLPQLRGDNARQQWYQAMGGHNPELFKRSFDLRQTVLKNIRDQRAQAKAEREGFTGSLGQFENELRHRDMALREARLQLQREYDKIERSTGEHLLYGVEEAVNLFKGLSAWGEVSYILRQGFIPLVTDTRAALKGDWQGVGHGLQGDNELWKWIGDKAGFDQAVQYLGDHSLSMFISKIRQHPRFLEAQNNGVRFTQIGDFNIADDHFSTKLLEAVPLYKRAEVAYTLPGDLQRLFIYDSWAKYIEGQNLSEVDERKAKKYAAETANAFTGKGNIAKLISREGALAKLASITFFSPQLLISRFQSAYRLSTGFATAPKGMRLQMAKKGARFYGLLALMLYIAGASLDPEDDDFGTLNVKKDSRLAKAIPDARDLHIDMLAGLDVPIQNGLRLFMGLGKAVMNNDRAYFNDAVLASWRQLGVNKQGEPRFLRSKLSPSASMIADWYTGKDYLGRPFSYWGAISSRVSPLAWQQTYDALLYDRLDAMKTEKQTPMTAREKLANERKWDNALVMLLGTFTGVGITQYPKDEKSKAMELASTLSDAVSKKDDETRRVEGVLRKLFKAQQEALVDGGNTSKVNAEINDWINKHPQLKSETKRLLGEAKSKTGLFSYYVKDLTLPELQRVQKVATGDELEVVNQMIKKVEKKKK